MVVVTGGPTWSGLGRASTGVGVGCVVVGGLAGVVVVDLIVVVVVGLTVVVVDGFGAIVVVGVDAVAAPVVRSADHGETAGRTRWRQSPCVTQLRQREPRPASAPRCDLRDHPRRAADCTPASRRARDQCTAGSLVGIGVPGERGAPETTLSDLQIRRRAASPRTKRSADASRSACIWPWLSRSSSAQSICSVGLHAIARRRCSLTSSNALRKTSWSTSSCGGGWSRDAAPVGQQVGELLIPAMAGGVRVAQHRLGDRHRLHFGLPRRRRAAPAAWPVCRRRAGGGSIR